MGRDPSTYLFTCISYLGLVGGVGRDPSTYKILVERDPSTYIFT